MTAGTVIVFARAPELGRVKTRLEPLLGPVATLELYRAMLTDTLHLARRTGARVVLAHTPTRGFAEQTAADACLVQPEGSFGRRMDAMLRAVHAQTGDGDPYVILGADAPHLPPEQVSDALAGLPGRGPSAVLGRCQAGGFYLLGFSGPPVPIETAWELPPEGEQVDLLLRRAGRVPRTLEEEFDVDEPKDFWRFVQLLAKLKANPAKWLPVASSALVDRWRTSGVRPFSSGRGDGPLRRTPSLARGGPAVRGPTTSVPADP